MRLNFQARGDGPALIILHGFLGSSDNWRAAAQRLAASFRVITLDLRNHGHSPHHPSMSYQAMAEDVLDFLVQQKLPSAHLLGHSMGGKVAMQAATTEPDNIDKLIVVDIAPKGYPASHEGMMRTLGELDLGSFKSFGEIDAALVPEIPSAEVRRFLIKNLAREGEHGFRWRIDLEAITANYTELAKPIEPKFTFTKPACFILGARSEYLTENDFPLVKKMFPQASFVTIPHAGHWVHVDAPEEFLKTVTAFLARHPPRTRGTDVQGRT